MKKKIGYILGALSLCFVLAFGGAEFPDPFFKNTLVILGGVALGVTGILVSIRLIRN